MEINLEPGKYLYKFVVDGSWALDPSNKLTEGIGHGNLNNVYYRTNYTFQLAGLSGVKEVYVAGSFNEWDSDELALKKQGDQWELPILLEPGSHTYKFIVDGIWRLDPANPDRIPNVYGTDNSLLSLGPTTLFSLSGHEYANAVTLSGDFNGWKEESFFLQKQEGGWALPIVLKPGNHAYHFLVDGEKILDPENPHCIGKGKSKNSIRVVGANHGFVLDGFQQAQSVMLTGDFNDWAEAGIQMVPIQGQWRFDAFLPKGKMRYKFIVDGAWMEDPANSQWETNEFGTKNSVVWVD